MKDPKDLKNGDLVYALFKYAPHDVDDDRRSMYGHAYKHNAGDEGIITGGPWEVEEEASGGIVGLYIRIVSFGFWKGLPPTKTTYFEVTWGESGETYKVKAHKTRQTLRTSKAGVTDGHADDATDGPRVSPIEVKICRSLDQKSSHRSLALQ